MSSIDKHSLNLKKILKTILVVFCSAFAGCFAQIYIMIPNGITSGGLPGIVRMITHFLPWNYSLVYYIVAMMVLILVFATLGWKDVSKIIALSITYPIMLFIMQHIPFELLTEKNQLLASIFVGILYGVATGVGYIEGFSSGGTDSIARVLKFTILKHVPISRIMLGLDGTIIILSAFVFDRNVALCALLSVFASSKTTEMILLGVSGEHVKVSIITDKSEEIIEYIMNEMHLGVSTYSSQGEYTKTKRRAIQVICTPRETMAIKSFLAEHDEDAFVTVVKLSKVWGKGRGFGDIHEVDNE